MITVREARITDLDEITAIYNWAVLNTTATFDLVVQSVESKKEWFSHYGGKHPLIVAEMDGKVVGYSSLSMFREKEAYQSTVELSVYVDKDFWHKGIGILLMREIIDRARKLGHHVVISGITSGNSVSISLHEKLGFSFCGEFKEVGYKFDKWQGVLFYQLIL